MISSTVWFVSDTDCWFYGEESSEESTSVPLSVPLQQMIKQLLDNVATQKDLGDFFEYMIINKQSVFLNL